MKLKMSWNGYLSGSWTRRIAPMSSTPTELDVQFRSLSFV